MALAIAGVAGMLAVPHSAEATFGYYGYGYGTKAKGMGGAGTALALDPLAGLTNPASLVLQGNVWALGGTLFNPNRAYQANDDFDRAPDPERPTTFVTPGRFDSGSEWFFIPNFARNWMLDQDSALTLTLAGNGGMNTDYDVAVFENFAAPGVATAPTGIDLIQLAVGLSYSRRLNDQHSLGITPILAVQGFKAEGLEPFRGVSAFPDKVTNNGRDYSYGAGVRIGWLGQITDELSLGASYQSKLKMSRFDKYKGLFAEGGKFDIAGTWNLGLGYKVTSDVVVALDVQRYLFSDIPAIGNPGDLPLDPREAVLGTDDGLGFGWKDVTAWKLGVQWQYDPRLTLRAGVADSNQPVPSSQALFNILAPGVTTRHYTVGMSYRLSDRSEISGSFMHAPRQRVGGKNPNTGPQTGFIQMDQNELELTFTRYLQ